MTGMSWSLLLGSLWSPWGAFQVAALALGWLVLGWRERRAFFAGAIAAALGALLLPAVLRLPQVLLGAPFRLEVMSIGALAGFATGFAAVRGPWLASLDRVAPALGAMVAVARLGCMSAGCDFGHPSDAPWAVRFAAGSPAALQHARLGLIEPAQASLPVHPTQLYEVALGLCMMWLASRRFCHRGRRFAAVAACYGAGRLLVELCRADEGRGHLGWLSMPQLVSLAILALSLIIATRDERRDAVNAPTR